VRRQRKLSPTLPRTDTERFSAVLEKRSQAVRAAVDSHLAVRGEEKSLLQRGRRVTWTATGARNAWI